MGYDKSLRKGGGGAHNWGSVRDEYDLERDALEDNDFEDEEAPTVWSLNTPCLEAG